jgi:hypothetical protein
MIYSNQDSFSGSKFFIFKKKNKIYLKKKFKKISQRDILSFHKQISFKNYKIGSTSIESCKIKDINAKKNYILLEYNIGLSGSNILLNGNYKTFQLLDNFLKKFVDKTFSNLKLVKINKIIYLNKINQIKRKLNKNHLSVSNIFESRILKILKKIKFGCHVGYCHGDLTLSNLIISTKKNKIILIDFLHSYNDSPLQDICKLIQDLKLYWTSRYLEGQNFLRAKIFCNNLKLFQNIRSDIKKDYIEILELELLMTLYRILPYTSGNDLDTLKWIKNAEKQIGKKFLNNI